MKKLSISIFALFSFIYICKKKFSCTNYAKFSERSCLTDEYLHFLIRTGVTHFTRVIDWLKKNKHKFHTNLFLLNILKSKIFFYIKITFFKNYYYYFYLHYLYKFIILWYFDGPVVIFLWARFSPQSSGWAHLLYTIRVIAYVVFYFSWFYVNHLLFYIIKKKDFFWI